MQIKLFGVLQEAAGGSLIEIEATPDLVSLKEKLIINFPMLNYYNFQIAVNQVKAETNLTISETDEIALLPPYAGG